MSNLQWVKASEHEESYDDEWQGPYIMNVISPNGLPYVTAGYYHTNIWHWAEGKKPVSKDFTVTHYMEMPEPPTESHSSIEGEEKKVKLDISVFSKLSAERAETGFKTYRNVPILYWTTALCGEAGELCNMIKKIERVRYGGIDGGSTYTAADLEKADIAEEIGGVFIYLNLLSSLLEIDMEEAIIKTFHDKSKKYRFAQFYPESQSPALPVKEEEKEKHFESRAARKFERLLMPDNSNPPSDDKGTIIGTFHFDHENQTETYTPNPDLAPIKQEKKVTMIEVAEVKEAERVFADLKWKIGGYMGLLTLNKAGTAIEANPATHRISEYVFALLGKPLYKAYIKSFKGVYPVHRIDWGFLSTGEIYVHGIRCWIDKDDTYFEEGDFTLLPDFTVMPPRPKPSAPTSTAKPSIGESLEKVISAQYTTGAHKEEDEDPRMPLVDNARAVHSNIPVPTGPNIKPVPAEPAKDQGPEQYGSVWDAWENFQDECEKKFPMGMHHEVQKESPNSLLPKNHYVIRRASAEWGAKWMRDALRTRLEEQALTIPHIEAYWQQQLSEAKPKIEALERERDDYRQALHAVLDRLYQELLAAKLLTPQIKVIYHKHVNSYR